MSKIKTAPKLVAAEFEIVANQVVSGSHINSETGEIDHHDTITLTLEHGSLCAPLDLRVTFDGKTYEMKTLGVTLTMQRYHDNDAYLEAVGKLAANYIRVARSGAGIELFGLSALLPASFPSATPVLWDRDLRPRGVLTFTRPENGVFTIKSVEDRIPLMGAAIATCDPRDRISSLHKRKIEAVNHMP